MFFSSLYSILFYICFFSSFICCAASVKRCADLFVARCLPPAKPLVAPSPGRCDKCQPMSAVAINASTSAIPLSYNWFTMYQVVNLLVVLCCSIMWIRGRWMMAGRSSLLDLWNMAFVWKCLSMCFCQTMCTLFHAEISEDSMVFQSRISDLLVWQSLQVQEKLALDSKESLLQTLQELSSQQAENPI